MVQKTDINPQTGKAYAVNPSTGVWDDNYWATQVEPKIAATDPQALIQKSIQQYQEANKPAVASLEASIPETTAKYAQTRSQLEAKEKPLMDRYKNLLDEIKGNQQVAETRQTTTTNNELGRRGISNDSGVYEREMTNALNPITHQYTTLSKDAGLAQEDDLRALRDTIANLTTSEVGDNRAIRNAIAQLQSGAATQGIGLGQNLYQTNVQQQLAQQQIESEAKQRAIDNAMKQAQLDLQTKQVNYETGKPYYQPASGGGGIDLSAIMGLLGEQTSQPSAAPKSFQESNILNSNVRKQYGW